MCPLRTVLVVPIAVLALTAVTVGHAARADSAPIGKLPPGPTVTISASPGTTVALSLPTASPASGLVWRIARRFDTRVARQVAEGEIGRQTIVTFALVGRGTTTIRFANTRGDASSVARATRSFRLVSR